MTPIGQLLRALGGEVAHAALDGHVDLDRHVVRVDGQQVLVRIDDLDVGVLLDVVARDRAGAGLEQAQLHRVRRVALEAQLLDVEHHLGDVFLDARDGAELVIHVADLDGRHGRALERAEQHAAQGIADGDAVTGGKRAGLVLGVRLLWLAYRLDLRAFNLNHLNCFSSAGAIGPAAREAVGSRRQPGSDRRLRSYLE